MKENRKILIVSPAFPSEINGLGDYSSVLGKELSQKNDIEVYYGGLPQEGKLKVSPYFEINKNNTLLTIVKAKTLRLVSSSENMLHFVTDSNLFPKSIIKLYQLKHLDRLYNNKEVLREKSLLDILKLLIIIVSRKYSFKDIHTYRLFYRLAPSWLINLFKKSK